MFDVHTEFLDLSILFKMNLALEGLDMSQKTSAVSWLNCSESHRRSAIRDAKILVWVKLDLGKHFPVMNYCVVKQH